MRAFIIVCPKKNYLSLLVILGVGISLLWQPGHLYCGEPGLPAAHSLQPPAPMEKRLQPCDDLMSIDCNFLPYPGTHYYNVFYHGLYLGQASVEVNTLEDGYQIKVNAKTNSLLNALYKVKYRGEVTFSTHPLTPSSASIVERTGSKTKKYEMEFSQPDRVTVTEMEQKGKKTPKFKEKEFQAEKSIFDPFSTVYLIRSIDWRTGLMEIFEVITGNKHYELLLTCTGTTTLTLNGNRRETWIIQPQTRNLEKKSSEREPAVWSIYVSRDEMREILKIEGYPKIGQIVAEMQKFERTLPQL
jgi:hypothetical protein